MEQTIVLNDCTVPHRVCSHPVVPNSLWPHGLQRARPPCPSPPPGVCPSSCSLRQWCCPAISSSDILFCPQSFPASGTFPMSHLFTSDDQNTGASASSSFLAVNIRGWSPLTLTGLISLLSKRLSGVFTSTIVWRDQCFSVLPSLRSALTTIRDHWEDHSLDYLDVCRQSNLCYSTRCLGLSSLSCQEAIIFWFHGYSHHLQWFWSPRRGNLSLLPPFPLPFAISNGAGCHDLRFLFVCFVLFFNIWT